MNNGRPRPLQFERLTVVLDRLALKTTTLPTKPPSPKAASDWFCTRAMRQALLNC